MILPNIKKKLHEIEKNLARKGGCIGDAPLDLLLTYEHPSSQSAQRVSLQAQVTQSIQVDEGAILYGTQAIIVQSQGF